ncbi:MAG: pentapeptide repeat-containing protein [Alphaproteobacteria bacterium]|nr:pentapeptide repeat-containing protein [Alphaproteobacteria bacterium]
MSDDLQLETKLELKKAKIMEQKHKFAQEKSDVSWSAVAVPEKNNSISDIIPQIWTPSSKNSIDFQGKNLENGNFAGENLENARFSGANLRGINLSGANLRGVDLSGADLTGANLEGADLTGANLNGAKLIGTNLKKAKLHDVIIEGADLTDAIFLEIDIDNLTLENLQELIEYLAKYYPHKLNLTKINLTLLDLSRIDLSQVNLRGVDFTGVDFTGVNIMELDLSECIITPEQIAQALGRVPSPEELKKILAPKPKKKKNNFKGIDLTDFFFDNGIPAGIWFTGKDKGLSFEQIFGAVKRFTNAFKKDEKEHFEPVAKTKEDSSANDELRRIIEENKKLTLEEKKKESGTIGLQPKEIEQDKKIVKQRIDNMMLRQRGDNSRG